MLGAHGARRRAAWIAAAMTSSIMLGACAPTDVSGATRADGRCLYAIEIDYGRMLRYGSCSNPPPMAIKRISGPDG